MYMYMYVCVCVYAGQRSTKYVKKFKNKLEMLVLVGDMIASMLCRCVGSLILPHLDSCSGRVG